MRDGITVRRSFGLVLLFAAGMASPAGAATQIDNPAAFVRAVYGHLAKDSGYAPPEDIYSPHLQALWADEKHDAGGEVGRIEFDFWIDGQDGQPKGVQIRTLPVESHRDRQVVIAKFSNLGKVEVLRFYFEQVRGAWRLDEVISAGSGPLKSWTLSTILKYGWAE